MILMTLSSNKVHRHVGSPKLSKHKTPKNRFNLSKEEKHISVLNTGILVSRIWRTLLSRLLLVMET